MRSWMLAGVLLVGLGGCSPSDVDEDYTELRVVLPSGNVEDGRQAFVDLSCMSCHRVEGDSKFQSVTSANPGPDLGPAQAAQHPRHLASSIVAPSHEVLGEETEGGLSHMGDYSYAMTVRQLVDLIAYLQSPGPVN